MLYLALAASKVSEPAHDCKHCSLLRIEGGGLELTRWRRLRSHPDGCAACWFQPVATKAKERKGKPRGFTSWLPQQPGISDLLGLPEVACGFFVKPVQDGSCQLLWHVKLARSGFMLKAALGSMCPGPLRRLARDLSAAKASAPPRTTAASAAEGAPPSEAEPLSALESDIKRASSELLEASSSSDTVGTEPSDLADDGDTETGEDVNSESGVFGSGQSHEAARRCLEDAIQVGTEGSQEPNKLDCSPRRSLLDLLDELQIVQDIEDQSSLARGPSVPELAEPQGEDAEGNVALDGEASSASDADERGVSHGVPPIKISARRFRGQCKVSQWLRRRRKQRPRFQEPLPAAEHVAMPLPDPPGCATSDPEPATIPERAAPRASAIPCYRRPKRAEGPLQPQSSKAPEPGPTSDQLRSSSTSLRTEPQVRALGEALCPPHPSPKQRRKKPKPQSWTSVPAEASDAIAGLADWLLSLQDSIEREAKVAESSQLADFFGPSPSQPPKMLPGRGSDKCPRQRYGKKTRGASSKAVF